MANPILKEDLIANDVQPALDKMLETLGKIDGALTSMRGSLSQHAKGIMDDVNAHQSDADAMGKYAAKITELEKAISDLTKAQKENANMQSQVHAAKAKSIELSEYEKRHLEELEKRLKLGAVWQERTAQAIDTTNMSYNAMKATLNTLLSTLRSFETESKKNSTEAMALESAVERLRDAMKELDGNTKAVANAEKQMAEESKKAAKEAADAAKEEEKAYQASQKEAKARADAAQKIHDARQKEIEDAFKARDAEQQRLKLNDQEFAALNQLKAALASEGHARMDAVQGIDIQKMSYNELYQTYNAIKDVLNAMTVAERENTEAGKKLTEQSLKIHDTLNELQKSTGNYTLQVGKYRAAFDGLGYSFQQILREIPSALNPQQFFLAISNNIPLFMDQVKAFKAEQEEIKKRMQELEEAGQTATEEYVNLGNKVESFGSKMKKSILSWQTAILAIVMALRSYGQDIINWIGTLFNGVETMAQRLKNLVTEVQGEAAKNYKETETELELLLEKMEEVNYAGKEYKDIVARINEITGSTFDITKNMPDEIRKATEEYIKMQKVIAVNAAIIDKMTPSLLIRNAMTGANGTLKADDVKAYLKPFVTDDDDLSMIASMIASKNTVEAALKEGRAPNFGMYEFRFGNILRNTASSVSKAFSGDYNWKMVDPTIYGYEGLSNFSLSDEGRKTLEEYLRLITKELEKELSEYGYLSDAEMAKLESMYDAAVNLKGGGNGSKKKEPKENDIDYRYRDYLEARIELTKVGYEKEIALSGNMLERENDQLVDWHKEQLTKLRENLQNGFITEVEYKGKKKELDDTYNMLFEKAEEEHRKRIDAINTKYAEMDRKVIVEEELGWIEELDAAYKVDENNRRRRIKTIKDEELSNQRITESILKMREEIEKLQEKNLTQPEAIEQRTKRIQELEKAIAKLQTQIDHTKQLSNYSSIGDIFRRNVSVGAGTQQSLMESILGKDAYSAFAPGSKELQDAIEKDFDTWMKSAEQTLTTWYSTTMGYINDLISAYVELANAKAEAAKEATDAAQEEYEKEKALLEAGYASRVEATWAEYQEKKAAQEKAEEDAKAAAKAQQEINNLSTMGSLITAAANIWKTFTEIPVVGIPLAIAATGTMFAAFLAAKIKANEVSKYGEGGFEVLEGGSHASGHDIDLGVNNRKGRRMRAEGKEGLGIFSRRAMAHYGANNIEAMVNSVNRLEFEGNAAKRMSLERSVGMAVLSAPRTDLRRLESSVDKLVGYGSRSRTVNADGSVTEIRKNAKIVYKNG